MKINLTIIILLLLLTSSCITEKLKTQRTDYLTGEFETDGFYYTKPNKNNYYYAKCFVFYKNGVYFGDFGVGKSKNDIIEFLLDEESVKQSKDLAYSWGVFQVHNDTIIFEKWISSDAFGGYPTIKYYGKVISKEKLIINFPVVSSTIKQPDNFKLDTLYFHRFEPKPDSTNVFIKN